MEITTFLEQFPEGIEFESLQWNIDLKPEELQEYLDILIEKGMIVRKDDKYLLTERARQKVTHEATVKATVASNGH